MTISYYASATTVKPLILGDDDDGLFISGYSGDKPSEVREVRFYEVTEPLILSIGFKGGQRSFNVDIAHDTAADAFLFSEQYPEQVFLSGILQITDDDATVYMDANRVDVKLIERNGYTTIFAHSFAVGPVRTTLS